MNPGDTITIERCATGFLVYPAGKDVNTAPEIHAFSEIGRSDYFSNLTLLAWVAKHFEPLDNDKPAGAE